MPQRSNFFQRLIFMIEHGLADGPDTTVRESVLLADQRTGEEREVDILIESSVNGYPVRIAVECRNYRRKCDSTWIEQLIGKYADLPVDKVIAVSRRGFYEPAVEKARQYGLHTLSLEEVPSADWQKMLLGTTSRGNQVYSIVRPRAWRLQLVDSADYEEASASDFWIRDRAQQTLWHIPDFERSLIEDDELWEQMRAASREVRDALAKDTTRRSLSTVATLSHDVDYLLTDAAGREWRVDQVIVEFEIRVRYSIHKEFDYRDQRITVDTFGAEGEIVDAPTGWVGIEPKHGDKSGMLRRSFLAVSGGEFRPLRIPADFDSISEDTS